MSTIIVAAILGILVYLAIRHVKNTGPGCCDTHDSSTSSSCPNCKK